MNHASIRRVCPRCGAQDVAHTDGIYAVCGNCHHVWPCRIYQPERTRAEGDAILRDLQEIQKKSENGVEIILFRIIFTL